MTGESHDGTILATQIRQGLEDDKRKAELFYSRSQFDPLARGQVEYLLLRSRFPLTEWLCSAQSSVFAFQDVKAGKPESFATLALTLLSKEIRKHEFVNSCLFICGYHLDDALPNAGVLGLVRSLIVQVMLGQPSKDFTAALTLTDTNILCNILQQALERSCHSMHYFLIDGISLFEREKWQGDLVNIISQIIDLTEAVRDRGRIVKILFGSPGVCHSLPRERHRCPITTLTLNSPIGQARTMTAVEAEIHRVWTEHEGELRRTQPSNLPTTEDSQSEAGVEHPPSGNDDRDRSLPSDVLIPKRTNMVFSIGSQHIRNLRLNQEPSPALLIDKINRFNGEQNEGLSGAPDPPAPVPEPQEYQLLKEGGFVASFDEHSIPDKGTASMAEAWFCKLENGVHKRFPQRRGSEPRVQIAILDTGIDLSRPSVRGFRERIKCVETFVHDPEGHQGQDRNGHGTDVAIVTNKVAPEANLLIAQITERKEFDNVNAVTKAIVWAISKGVDIMVMSWGFQSTEPNIEFMLDAARQKNILMFAAASNHGGLGGITFPAKSDHVICINACDGYNNRCDFSPTAVYYHDNLACLGASIDCGGGRVRSGTSYSTPVAAGIAALVLEYSSLTLTDDEHIEKARLKSRTGMQAILRCMSERERDPGYACIKPWNLFRKENVRGEILDIMRTI